MALACDIDPNTYRKGEFAELLNSYEKFLGTSEKLRKATMSFVASVRTSARMKQLVAFHWTHFDEI